MGTVITICLIGFAVVFAELYSIRDLISRFKSSADRNSELTRDIKSLRYTAEEMLRELEKMHKEYRPDDNQVYYILHVAKEKIEEVKSKYP